MSKQFILEVKVSTEELVGEFEKLMEDEQVALVCTLLKAMHEAQLDEVERYMERL